MSCTITSSHYLCTVFSATDCTDNTDYTDNAAWGECASSDAHSSKGSPPPRGVGILRCRPSRCAAVAVPAPVRIGCNTCVGRVSGPPWVAGSTATAGGHGGPPLRERAPFRAPPCGRRPHLRQEPPSAQSGRHGYGGRREIDSWTVRLSAEVLCRVCAIWPNQLAANIQPYLRLVKEKIMGQGGIPSSARCPRPHRIPIPVGTAPVSTRLAEQARRQTNRHGDLSPLNETLPPLPGIVQNRRCRM
ncbi:MAG: hypothetical protein KatS3mg050_0217 [Litorilinea sp.]|nr:MAG: hypothetical protein KatS3mg050_0217 [Litorilinea sp.]